MASTNNPRFKPPKAFCSDKALYEDQTNKSFDRRQWLKSRDYWKVDNNIGYQSDIDDVPSSLNSSFESESINNSVSCCENSVNQNDSCLDSLYEPPDIDKSLAGASESIRELSDDDRSIINKPTLNRTNSMESDHIDEIENLIFDSLECEATCAPRKLSVGKTFSIEDNKKVTGEIRKTENVLNVGKTFSIEDNKRINGEHRKIENVLNIGKTFSIEDASKDDDKLDKIENLLNAGKTFPIEDNKRINGEERKKENMLNVGRTFSIEDDNRDNVKHGQLENVSNNNDTLSENKCHVVERSEYQRVIPSGNILNIMKFVKEISKTSKSSPSNVKSSQLLEKQNNGITIIGQEEPRNANFNEAYNYEAKRLQCLEDIENMNGEEINIAGDRSFCSRNVLNNSQRYIGNSESTDEDISEEDSDSMLELDNRKYTLPQKRIFSSLNGKNDDIICNGIVQEIYLDNENPWDKNENSTVGNSFEEMIKDQRLIDGDYLNETQTSNSHNVATHDNWERTNENLLYSPVKSNDNKIKFGSGCLNKSTVLADVNSEINFLQDAEDEYMLNEIDFKFKAVEDIVNNFMFLGDTKTTSSISSVDEDEDIDEISGESQDFAKIQRVDIIQSPKHDSVYSKCDSYVNNIILPIKSNDDLDIKMFDVQRHHSDLTQCSNPNNESKIDLNTVNKTDLNSYVKGVTYDSHKNVGEEDLYSSKQYKIYDLNQDVTKDNHGLSINEVQDEIKNENYNMSLNKQIHTFENKECKIIDDSGNKITEPKITSLPLEKKLNSYEEFDSLFKTDNNMYENKETNSVNYLIENNAVTEANIIKTNKEIEVMEIIEGIKQNTHNFNIKSAYIKSQKENVKSPSHLDDICVGSERELNLVVQSSLPEGGQNICQNNDTNDEKKNEFDKNTESIPIIELIPSCNIGISVTPAFSEEDISDFNKGFSKAKGAVDIRALLEEENSCHEKGNGSQEEKCGCYDQEHSNGKNNCSVVFQNMVNDAKIDTVIDEAKLCAMEHDTIIFNTEVDTKRNHMDNQNAKENYKTDVNNITLTHDTDELNNDKENAELNNEKEITEMKNHKDIAMSSKNFEIHDGNDDQFEKLSSNNIHGIYDKNNRNMDTRTVNNDLENKEKCNDIGDCKYNVAIDIEEDLDICYKENNGKIFQAMEYPKVNDNRNNEKNSKSDDNFDTEYRNCTTYTDLVNLYKQKEAAGYENVNIVNDNVNIGWKHTDSIHIMRESVESPYTYMNSDCNRKFKEEEIETHQHDNILDPELCSNNECETKISINDGELFASSHGGLKDELHDIYPCKNHTDTTRKQDNEVSIYSNDNDDDIYQKDITENLENLIRSNDEVSIDGDNNSLFKSSNEDLNKLREGKANWGFDNEENIQNNKVLTSNEVNSSVDRKNIWAFENNPNVLTRKSSSVECSNKENIVDPNTHNMLISEPKMADTSNAEDITNGIESDTLNDDFEIVEIDEISIGIPESNINDLEASVCIEQQVDNETVADTIESFSDYIERKTREIKEEQERKEREQEEEQQEQFMRNLDISLERVLRQMEEKNSNMESCSSQYSLGIDDEITERKEELQEIINDGLMGILKREQIEKRETTKIRRKRMLKVQKSIPDAIPEEREIDRIVEMVINELDYNKVLEKDSKLKRAGTLQSLDKLPSLECDDSNYDTANGQPKLKNEIKKIQKEINETFNKYKTYGENPSNNESGIIKHENSELHNSNSASTPIKYAENNEITNDPHISSIKTKEGSNLLEGKMYGVVVIKKNHLLNERESFLCIDEDVSNINIKEHTICDADNDTMVELEDNSENKAKVSDICVDEYNSSINLIENSENNVNFPNICDDIDGISENFHEHGEHDVVYQEQSSSKEERVFVSLGGKLSVEVKNEEVLEQGTEGYINHGYSESEDYLQPGIRNEELSQLKHHSEKGLVKEENNEACLNTRNNVKTNTNQLPNIDIDQESHIEEQQSMQQIVKGNNETNHNLYTEENGFLEGSLNNVKSIINNTIKKKEDEYMLENRVENLNNLNQKKDKGNTNKDRESMMQNCIIYIKDDEAKNNTHNETENNTRFKEAGLIINGVRKNMDGKPKSEDKWSRVLKKSPSPDNRQASRPVKKGAVIIQINDLPDQELQAMEDSLGLNHYDQSCCKIC